MERDGDSPPIWSTPSTPFVPVRRRRRQSSVLNPVTLAIAFFVLLMFIIFLISSTLSRNNQVLKPTSSVKKSLNSIYFFFVLFVVLCGVFSRRNDETSSSDGAETLPINDYGIVDSGRRSVSGADWLVSPDREAYAKTSSYTNTGGNILRRNSSSYPDLRQESLWRNDGEKFRSFDDFEVDFHRPPGNFHRHDRQSHEVEKDFVVETTVREIPVDKFELKKSVPPPPTQLVSQGTQPPPPPPPPPVKRRRSVHSVAKQYNVERGGREAEFNEKRSPVSPPSKTPTPPPPPPPELKFHPLPERREKFQRKKSEPTKEFETAIVSLYQVTQGKRKNRSKSRYIFESVSKNSSPPTLPAPSPIPSVPPPPPPPPPSKNVLQNLFKKSSKGKRVHSISTANPPPPPPPPPPPSSIFNNIFKTGSKSKRFQLTSAASQSPPPPPPPPPPPSSIFNNIFKTGSKSKRFQLTSAASKSPPPPPPPPPSIIFNSLFKNEIKIQRLKYIETQSPLPPPPPPPLPTTARSRQKRSPASTVKPPKPTKPSTSHHESVVIAPASPLIPMPPPPPPFKIPELKFIKKGDFVRISSANSSRCSSPGREDFDVMSVKSDGGDSTGPSFTCPSPDVDSKADTFISMRRDEWRLEKINSLKEQRNTGSRSARLG